MNLNQWWFCVVCVGFSSCHSHKHFFITNHLEHSLQVFIFPMSISLLLVNFDVHSNIEQKPNEKIFRANCIFGMRRGKNPKNMDEMIPILRIFEPFGLIRMLLMYCCVYKWYFFFFKKKNALRLLVTTLILHIIFVSDFT